MDVSRYVDTVELKFEVEFITPCFLGGADGNAEIRTAPFKNLIRRWWRIANGHLSSEELWKKEAELFGSTQKNPDIVEANRSKKSSEKQPEIFGKSKVELKIEQIKSSYYGKNDIDKKELKDFLYLGYGPVQTSINDIKTFIKAKSKILCTLKVPKNEEKIFINVLTLINLFGSMGARSRKGFGSISIIPLQCENCFKLNKLDILKSELPNLILKAQHHNKTYPYCLGEDEKGILCWYTSNMESYQEVLNYFQVLYKDIVMEIKPIKNGRFILGSAESKKKLNIDRLPSQLILKVWRNGSKFQGRILHLPYNISAELETQNDVWKKVYAYLDNKDLKRLGGNSK